MLTTKFEFTITISCLVGNRYPGQRLTGTAVGKNGGIQSTSVKTCAEDWDAVIIQLPLVKETYQNHTDPHGHKKNRTLASGPYLQTDANSPNDSIDTEICYDNQNHDISTLHSKLLFPQVLWSRLNTKMSYKYLSWRVHRPPNSGRAGLKSLHTYVSDPSWVDLLLV